MSTQENVELQEILDKPFSQANHRPKVPKEEQPNLAQAQSETEYCQWVVLSNGRYAAAGASADWLPAGAYTLLNTPDGLFFEKKKILTDTLIDLGNSNSTRVIEGIKLFWKRRQRFIERGILFKRGILLWGPPGSGKTATLAFLVQDLIAQGGIVLLVQHPGLAVIGLQRLRKIEPERPLIVVLEDVEEIIQSCGEHELLGLLDGEHQTDNVVNIATTNYPEMLGARIINRPSRFDEVVKIGMPSPEMRRAYLLHVLCEEKEHSENVDTWVHDTQGMSIAHLKELVIAVTCLEQNYDDVISRLRSMKVTPRSSMYEKSVGFGLVPETEAPPAQTAGGGYGGR